MKPLNNFSFDITLTLSCNNDCLFCPRKDFLKFIACRSKKEIYQEIEEISKRSQKIVLTGGEVTVFPQIFEILKLCQNKFKEIEIISNGRRLKDKNFLKKLISSGVNQFAISIYSLTEQIHDKITRKKGSCQETKNGILNLLNTSSRKIKVRINITLNYWNASTIIETIKQLYRQGIRNFTVAEEIILNSKAKILNLKEIRKILEQISNLKLKKLQIFFKGFPPCLVRDLLNPSIIYEPYQLESSIKKGSGKEKYLKKFQNNFIKLKKCSTCFLNNSCLGIQKYYRDINQYGKPVMMKNLIVLINPLNPDPPPNYFGPPYSLSLIGAVLLKNKKPVKAYDFDQRVFSIGEIINKDKPKYIGITIQSCTRGPVYKLIKEIKQIDRSIKIILGGPFASQYYELLLKNFLVDYVVIGDGEITLNELLNCLESRGDTRNIKGIAFFSEGEVCFTGEREQIKDLDLLPYPAFHLFRNFDKKINGSEEQKFNFILGKRCTSFKNALMLLSSRGCVYYCNFCPMSKVFKNKIRFHSPGYFVDMLEYFYKRYKIKNYIFGDNNFTLDKNRASEICNEIIKRKLKIQWSCMTRSDGVTHALLEKMARADCFEIFYGVESGSPKIQKRIGKNLNLNLTRKVFKWTEKLGMRSNLMLMVGNCGETRETIKETLIFIKEMNPSNIIVKVTKVYPGTEIHDLFERKGLLPENYYLTSEFNPPAFTLEHNEAELNKFEEMIQPRTTFIEINSFCNNHCRFCRLNQKIENKNLEEIKKELIISSMRGEHVVLTGGEPLMRKDFFQILNFADQIPIHHLHCYSNARIFFYESLAKKIGKTKLRKIIIPFFGPGNLHDQITMIKNSFIQTIQGIKNLKDFAHNLKIQVKIFILSSNYKSLQELTRFLLSLDVDEFRFVFLSDFDNKVQISLSDLPPMKRVMPQLKKISELLDQNRKTYDLVGFPLCIPQVLKEHIAEPFYLFDEVITLEKKIINCRQERIKDKEKLDFCLECKDHNLCEGIWKKYGTKKFKPF